VAQFYDHKTEVDLPKWLIAFDNPADAEVYRTRKEWLETVLIEKGCKFNIGPCGKSAKPLKSTVQKTQSKKKRGGGTPRGRGRGGK
jgi:hypothetical protein